jgi:hypothetical protein
MNDIDKELSRIYATAINAEDNYPAVLAYLEEHPQLLGIIVRDWMERYLLGHAQCVIRGVVESPDNLFSVAHLVPNLFAKAARLAFSEAHLTDNNTIKVSTENEIQSIQEWLTANHPEISEDIKSEEASIDSYINSPASAEDSKRLMERIRKMSEGE